MNTHLIRSVAVASKAFRQTPALPGDFLFLPRLGRPRIAATGATEPPSCSSPHPSS